MNLHVVLIIVEMNLVGLRGGRVCPSTVSTNTKVAFFLIFPSRLIMLRAVRMLKILLRLQHSATDWEMEDSRCEIRFPMVGGFCYICR